MEQIKGEKKTIGRRREEMNYLPLLFSLCLLLLLKTAVSTTAAAHNTLNKQHQVAESQTLKATCPINFSYVETIPWDFRPCQQTQPTTTDPIENHTQICCQTLLSLFGLALALRLRTTSLFHLPDIPTAASCVSDFQSVLTNTHLSLSPHVAAASRCFGSPSRFAASSPNSTCARILSARGWRRAMGPTPAFDAACAGDLSDLTLCKACVAEGFKVSSQLTAADGDSSHSTLCFYFTVLYAAGVVNSVGPDNPSTAACILGLAFLPPSPPQGRRRSPTALAGAGAAAGSVLALAAVGACLWWRRKRLPPPPPAVDDDRSSRRRVLRPKTGSIWFEIGELEQATGGFCEQNLIGRGGFGVVYRGTLSDGTMVAVKKTVPSEFQGESEFRNEVEIIGNLRHRNLVPLIGCCIVAGDGDCEGDQRYLVYEYMGNGNLEDHIFNSNKNRLSWECRKSTLLDVAKGLAYLHYGIKPAIYHRDIKATNVLLDGEMKARVGDFGLVRQSTEGQSHMTTRVAGTHGYLAPEYALYGQLTEKSDVYSYGVLVLEVMSGRRALELSSSGPLLITDWAWTLVKSGRAEEVLERSLRDEGNPKGLMERYVKVGILCAHAMVALRPTMLEALKILEGDVEVPQIPDRPLPLGHVDANVFSFSPSSALSLLSTDMLR